MWLALMMTRSTSPLSSLVMNSLKITSSSGSWCGTLNRLNNKIMKSPTTTQKSMFFVLEFIQISLWMAGSNGLNNHDRERCYHRYVPTDNRTTHVLLLISLQIQDSQIGKVPVLLLVIEPVPDHILIWNL